MLRKHFPLCLLCCLLFGACRDLSVEEIPESTPGLAPVYLPENWQDIAPQAPRSIESPAQILRRDGFVFVLDVGKGIHIIDNRSSDALTKTSFWKISGCKKMAFHDEHFYVNNHHDLLIFRVEANAALTLDARLANVFQLDFDQNFPAHFEGFFECVDEGRGLVIDWKDTILIQPQCWR